MSAPSIPSERLAYDANDVAALLGLHPVTIRNLMASGELPSLKVGSRRLVLATELQAFLERQAEAERNRPDAERRRVAEMKAAAARQGHEVYRANRARRVVAQKKTAKNT